MPYSQEIIDLGEKVKNWGRWGDDDEIGTINFITNEVVKEATKCVKSGKRHSNFKCTYTIFRDNAGSHQMRTDLGFKSSISAFEIGVFL